jgi:hypothetical protein
MRKIIWLAAVLLASAFGFAADTATVHADIFQYPCQYPGVGTGAEAMGVSGQFCDYPTEANGSHWHCESGGFHAGGLGLAGQQGVSLGALSVIGGGGEGCSWRCPDGTLAPAPNPPGAWNRYLVPRLNFCRDHDAPAGPTSALVDPQEGSQADSGPPPEEPAPPLPPGPPRQGPPPPKPQGEVPVPVPGVPAPIPVPIP